MDSRTEVRCWRALAAAALLGAVLLGCGGGDEEPVRVAPAPGAPPAAEVAPTQPLSEVLAVAVPPAAPAPVAAAPCDRPTPPPYGAQAALHAQQQATEGEFAALAEAGRRQHAGTVPTHDPMAEPAEPR